MPLLAKPYRFSPSGLSDTLDSTDNEKGTMAILQNLIPEPTTKNLWMCRPAATTVASFAGFTNPGFVSAFKVIGSYIIGMIASTRFSGKDEPFVYNITTGNFVTISGVTNSNTPTSPSSSGTWVPPTVAVVGIYAIITHPGFDGVTNGSFGYINISNFTGSVWASGNTSGGAGAALVCPPSAVAVFNGRAWYACNPTTGQPGLYFSDVLAPLTLTNGSTQVITFDDNLPLTALAGLPLANQLGGVIQSLIVFKGTTNLYQITGDASSSSNPLAKNSLNSATGTLAPNTVCATPIGLAFLAPDGLRLIDFNARVSDPIGIAGQGVNAPFLNITTASRAVAACNTNLLRITIQNNAATGAPFQEYWFDLARKIWSGPHTCAASLIQPYQNTFLMTPQVKTATIWKSDSVQTSSSQYVENGSQLTWVFRTSMLPDAQQESYSALMNTTLNLAPGTPSEQFTASVGDENGILYTTYTFSAGTLPSNWGSMTWGSSIWLGSLSNLHPIPINWPIPVVYRRIFFDIRAGAQGGIKIGDLYGKIRPLGYVGT